MWLLRRTFPHAASIVAVSEGVAEDILQTLRVPSEKVVTIYNPVVTPEIRELAGEPPDHPWFGDEKVPVVLGAGSLSEQKDFGTLIRSFAVVRSRIAAKLVILGEGSARFQLERLVAELGLQDDVLLPGFVRNPFGYMAQASAFVLSSRYEGLPGVLIQAMACGCPVVSTDCPSGPAEILEGGRLGPLVPMGDVGAMAHAILDMLDRPTSKEALIARADHFSLERSVAGYLDLLFGLSAGVQRAAHAELFRHIG
jgi:glycosyltransferase involved in cell wall biosynthesis